MRVFLIQTIRGATTNSYLIFLAVNTTPKGEQILRVGPALLTLGRMWHGVQVSGAASKSSSGLQQTMRDLNRCSGPLHLLCSFLQGRVPVLLVFTFAIYQSPQELVDS